MRTNPRRPPIPQPPKGGETPPVCIPTLERKDEEIFRHFRRKSPFLIALFVRPKMKKFAKNVDKGELWCKIAPE